MSVDSSETIHLRNIRNSLLNDAPCWEPRAGGAPFPDAPVHFFLSGEIAIFVSGQSYLYIRYKNKHLRPMDSRSRSTFSLSDTNSVFTEYLLRLPAERPFPLLFFRRDGAHAATALLWSRKDGCLPIAPRVFPRVYFQSTLHSDRSVICRRRQTIEQYNGAQLTGRFTAKFTSDLIN